MIGILDNIHLALPEIMVLITACLALVAELFLRPRYASSVLIVAVTGLLLSSFVSWIYFGQYATVILHGLFISDDMGQLMKIFILVTVTVVYIYSSHYMQERQIPSGDFYVLGLFSTLGMMSLVSAHSLLSIYLGLELLSLPLYAMTAMQRRHGDGTEAAMKYFVMGSVASGMLLYGMSLLYGATGNLDLQAIGQVIATNNQHHQGLVLFAMVFMLAGIAFKLASVPFHMWAPDVYEGAPTSITLFLSAAPKIAALGMAIRVLTLVFPEMTLQWQPIILVMALLSAGLGNLLAIAQNNLKRLFAYSAISHLGYALLGILAATPAGYSSGLYYVLVYALMSVAAFGFLVLLSYGGVEIEQVDSLKGLNKRNPMLAFMMMIVMFSMAGIPPTVGFFAKLLVLKALVDVHMTWVAVVALVFAVMGAFYYLRIVKVMYFDEAEIADTIALPRLTYGVFTLNCLSLLYWGIFPTALITACVRAFS
jgi:NADH-quinone oxidoreductase subunit N